MSLLRVISRTVNAATVAAFLILNWQWWSGFDVTFLGPTVVLVVLSTAVDLFVGFRQMRTNKVTAPQDG